MDSGADKRTHTRVVSLNLVSYEAEDGPPGAEGEGIGRTRNLSEGGILLEVSKAYPLSALIDLRIALGEKIVHTRGRVVRLQELAGRRIEMGLKFVELSADDLRAIRDHVSSHRDATA